MEILAAYQLGFLATAVLLGLILIFSLPGGGKNPVFDRRFFTSMPGWLMFILLLTIITALLGDLSIFIVRLAGQHVTNLFHLPSACILVYCVIFRLVHLAWSLRRQAVTSD